MPGLLKMEEPDTRQQNGKHITSAAALPAEQTGASIAAGKKAEAPVMTNGASFAAPAPSTQTNPHTNGDPPTDTTMTSKPLFDGTPPELPHVSQGFYSLGDLIGRVTQESFNNLTTVMDEMSRIRLPFRPAPLLTNGASGSHGSSDDNSQDSPQNQEKKRKFLEYAQTTRERLIKCLVLTTWSAKMPDLRQLMDVLAYLRDTDQIYWQSAHSVGEIKRNMHPFKLPAPNLRHAAEVLSRGSAAWMGEFYEYLPRKPLSPEETLKTMRNMEVLLSTRFVLHEDLEPRLRDYRIANGRATFAFPAEFELDVTLASEDMTRQLYFLDLRFLFEPAPDIGSTRTRERLELKVNELLAFGGLSSACDFLRSFTLTHKITVLRSQAVSLQMSYWSRMLKIDQIHRSLIINYWLDSPMSKSWIEIGVSSGKTRPGQTARSGDTQSRLGLRWFRTAKSVAEAELPSIDLSQLSLEGILKETIASHAVHILQSLQKQLLKLAGGSKGKLQADMVTSPTEATDCCLDLKLGNLLKSVRIGIETISGRFFISPPNRRAEKVAQDLSSMKDPASETAGVRVMRYIYGEVQHLVKKQAERCRWTIRETKGLSPTHLRRVLGTEIRVLSLFQPRGWSKPGWAVVLVVDANAESWYIVKLSESTTNNGHQELRFSSVSKVVIPTSPKSERLLAEIEQAAIRQIAMQSAVEDLSRRGIQVQHASPKKPNGADRAASLMQGDMSPEQAVRLTNEAQQLSEHSLLFKLPSLIPDLSTPTPIFGDLAFISYSAFDPATAKVVLKLIGTILDKHKVVKALAGVKDQTMTIHKDGKFVLNVSVGLGEPFVDSAIAILRTLARLRSFALTIRKKEFKLSSLSAQSITFWYPSDYMRRDRCNLSLILHMQPKSRVGSRAGAPASEEPVSSLQAESFVKISMAPSNPHRHITGLLENYVGSNAQNGPAALMNCLITTWPLCVAFREMQTGVPYEHPEPPSDGPQQTGDQLLKAETSQATTLAPKVSRPSVDRIPQIYPHRPDSWKLTYSHPPSSWLLVLRSFRDQTCWQIMEQPYSPQGHSSSQALFSKDANGATRSEAFANELRELFAMGNTGQGWKSYRTMITANQGTGTTAAIRALHAVLGKYANDSAEQPNGTVHEGLMRSDAIAKSIEDRVIQDNARAGQGSAQAVQGHHRQAASGSRADAIRID